MLHSRHDHVEVRAGGGKGAVASLHRLWDPHEQLDGPPGRQLAAPTAGPSPRRPGRLPEGYIEEEYFLEGDATHYALAPGGGTPPTA